MKKIVITVAALVMFLNVAKAQTDSTNHRKLKVDEVNFVTSYYHQDGNNSAVTGGIGSEKLDDFGNSFDLQLSRFDKKDNNHTLGVELVLMYIVLLPQIKSIHQQFHLHQVRMCVSRPLLIILLRMLKIIFQWEGEFLFLRSTTIRPLGPMLFLLKPQKTRTGNFQPRHLFF